MDQESSRGLPRNREVIRTYRQMYKDIDELTPGYMSRILQSGDMEDLIYFANKFHIPRGNWADLAISYGKRSELEYILSDEFDELYESSSEQWIPLLTERSLHLVVDDPNYIRIIINSKYNHVILNSKRLDEIINNLLEKSENDLVYDILELVLELDQPQILPYGDYAIQISSNSDLFMRFTNQEFIDKLPEQDTLYRLTTDKGLRQAINKHMLDVVAIIMDPNMDKIIVPKYRGDGNNFRRYFTDQANYPYKKELLRIYMDFAMTFTDDEFTRIECKLYYTIISGLYEYRSDYEKEEVLKAKCENYDHELMDLFFAYKPICYEIDSRLFQPYLEELCPPHIYILTQIIIDRYQHVSYMYTTELIKKIIGVYDMKNVDVKPLLSIIDSIGLDKDFHIGMMYEIMDGVRLNPVNLKRIKSESIRNDLVDYAIKHRVFSDNVVDAIIARSDRDMIIQLIEEDEIDLKTGAKYAITTTDHEIMDLIILKLKQNNESIE
jgi:hypothetical protein